MPLERQFRDKYAGRSPERIYCPNSVRFVFKWYKKLSCMKQIWISIGILTSHHSKWENIFKMTSINEKAPKPGVFNRGKKSCCQIGKKRNSQSIPISHSFPRKSSGLSVELRDSGCRAKIQRRYRVEISLKKQMLSFTGRCGTTGVRLDVRYSLLC